MATVHMVLNSFTYHKINVEEEADMKHEVDGPHNDKSTSVSIRSKIMVVLKQWYDAVPNTH